MKGVQAQNTPTPTESAIRTGLECSLFARSHAPRTLASARRVRRTRRDAGLGPVPELGICA